VNALVHIAQNCALLVLLLVLLLLLFRLTVPVLQKSLSN
jgi:hypothetical protein